MLVGTPPSALVAPAASGSRSPGPGAKPGLKEPHCLWPPPAASCFSMAPEGGFRGGTSRISLSSNPPSPHLNSFVPQFPHHYDPCAVLQGCRKGLCRSYPSPSGAVLHGVGRVGYSTPKSQLPETRDAHAWKNKGTWGVCWCKLGGSRKVLKGPQRMSQL